MAGCCSPEFPVLQAGSNSGARLVARLVALLFAVAVWCAGSVGDAQAQTQAQVQAQAQTQPRHTGHPRLLLTRTSVEVIRAGLGQAPLFDQALQRAVQEVDREIANGLEVPVPRDFSGGYTHERHKRNFFVAHKAALLYQILDDSRYGQYVRDMLLEYAALYPTLPLHPRERSYARGRLFWQCLNDANWLLYMAQAYDAVYDFLEPGERDQIEQDLFRPFADFISLENPQFYNRIHNHSAWGSAAVGMIGLAMRDAELIDRALFGFQSTVASGARDNDGGLIATEEQ